MMHNRTTPRLLKRFVANTVETGQKTEMLWWYLRAIGGTAMIVGPLLLLAADLLRAQFPYPIPDQLAAFATHPTSITTAYSCFVLGSLVLMPAIILFVTLTGSTKPGWAMLGGALAITGIFVRAFHEGVNHLAFQLVNVQGLDVATKAVADSYTGWYVLYPLTFTDNLGWVILAITAYLSRTLGWFRSLALGIMAAHTGGVLKGSDLESIVLMVGLCIAFLPLGVTVLWELGLERRGAYTDKAL